MSDVPPVWEWPRYGLLLKRLAIAPVLSEQEIERIGNSNSYNPSTGEIRTELTKTEKRNLRLLAAGLTPKEIARARKISIHTVHVQIGVARQKLGMETTIQAVSYAIRMELI